MNTIIRNRHRCLSTLILCSLVASPSLWAQTSSKEMDHSKMDHGGMDHSKMDESAAPDVEMDHGDMDHANMDQSDMNHADMNHGDMNHDAMPDMQMDHGDEASGQMDHGNMDMKMQGGKAPADARDPNAYSGGFTLTNGPYSSVVTKQLKLADEHIFKSLLFNRFEYAFDSNTFTYDAQGWIGNTYDRLVVKAEGEIADGRLEDSKTDVLWGHAISTFWNTQAGARLTTHDEGESRQWLAFGVQGLAPYWFEVDITGYLGEQGRTALDVELEYELLLTQRLILQPRTEFSLYGDNDEINGIGKGFSSVAVGVRLRYEFSRQFAPYVGVEWAGKFGQTADYAQALGEPESDTSFVAGLRFWF